MSVAAGAELFLVARLHQPPPNLDARGLHGSLVGRSTRRIHHIKRVPTAVVGGVGLDLGARHRQAALLEHARNCSQAAKAVDAVHMHFEALGKASLDGGLKHALELGGAHRIKRARGKATRPTGGWVVGHRWRTMV